MNISFRLGAEESSDGVTASAFTNQRPLSFLTKCLTVVFFFSLTIVAFIIERDGEIVKNLRSAADRFYPFNVCPAIESKHMIFSLHEFNLNLRIVSIPLMFVLP